MQIDLTDSPKRKVDDFASLANFTAAVTVGFTRANGRIVTAGGVVYVAEASAALAGIPAGWRPIAGPGAAMTRAQLITCVTGLTLPTGSVMIGGGLTYRYIGTGTAIPDMPGWVPDSEYTPMHFGAVGDGVADDGASFNLALAAYKVAVEAIANSSGTVIFDGLGKSYKATVSIDATGITAWGWVIQNFTLFAHCTGKAALDMIGSRGGVTRRVIVVGDQVNIPRVGIQAARAAAGGQLAFCDNCHLENVHTCGYFDVVGGWFYGQETTTYSHCRFWNQNRNGASAFHVGTTAFAFNGVTPMLMASDYLAPITGETSFVNDKYINCDYRYMPSANSYAIASITQANPCVITFTAAHTLTVGQEVAVGPEQGMDEIYGARAVVTAATATTITLGAINSTGYSAFTSGGSVVLPQVGPTVIFGRGKDHHFDTCYIVNYGGTASMELIFGTSNIYSSDFEFLFEGFGQNYLWNIVTNGISKDLLCTKFITYQVRNNTAVFGTDATGAVYVTLNKCDIDIASVLKTMPHPKVFSNEAVFKGYQLNASIPASADITVSAMASLSGSIHTISNGLVRKFEGDQVGNIKVYPKTGTTVTKQYATSDGVVTASKSYDSATEAFGWSLNGTTTAFFMAPTAFYPTTDITQQLGLTTRRWLRGWFAHIDINGVDVKMTGLLVYADNAAAIAAGQPVGKIYRTATGEVRVVV